MLEYCSVVWHHSLSKTQCERLEAIRRRAIRIIFPVTVGMRYIFVLDYAQIPSLHSCHKNFIGKRILYMMRSWASAVSEDGYECDMRKCKCCNHSRLRQSVHGLNPVITVCCGGIRCSSYCYLGVQHQLSEWLKCPKLLLMTNRKLHMRFRLPPRSMTSDDIELL